MPRQREFNKDEVIARAMLIFWSQGYEATSIRNLQDAMGISSSSMYEVFGDKRGVYLAALAHFCELEGARISQMALESPTPKVFIEQLFNMLNLALESDNPRLGSMAFNAMIEFGTIDPEVTTLLLTHYIRIANIVAQAIADGQAAGTITSKEDATTLAHTILLTLQGISTIITAKPDFDHTSGIVRLTLKLLDT